MTDEQNQGIGVPWILISIVISIVLSKFSKNSMCQYLFLSFCWIFLTVLVTQSLGKYERNHKQITATTTGALIGWIIGTVLVWRSRRLNVLFFEV